SSKLYRVRYTGPARSGPKKRLVANQGLRDLRHSLEAFHGSKSGGAPAVEKAWPHLSHPDRNIRYAARLAIENQDLGLWRERVFSESNPRAVIYATIALCRHGEKSLSGRVLAKLGTVPFETLEQDDRLALLRAYSLCLIRLDQPAPAAIAALAARLDPFYPAADEPTNTELCRLLSYLDAPTVAAKTIALMKVTQAKTLAYDKEMLTRHEYGQAILKTMADTPNSQNIHYAYSLRRVRNGWTLEDRKHYFSWLNDTLKQSGGKSFAGYIRAIRQDAIDHLPPGDAASVSWLLGDIAALDLGKLPAPQGPPVAWTVDTAMELFKDGLHGRDFENGRRMFSAGRCVACHRFQGSGGYSGPDLGSVAKRYSIRDILVAICEPSQSISEQYQASTVTLKDGRTLHGRVIYRNDREIALATDPYNFSDLTKTPVDRVEKVELSQVSMMPPGTIYAMNKEELLNLMAYLLSGGDKRHKVFQAK
ncbi:MAG: c-type cytochrome, partial [Akkermansiaceae bacterium]|nr:c-type cytochrome [Akkermansiaceae bacterium]